MTMKPIGESGRRTMLIEFRGACGGKVAIETAEIVYAYEIELLGAKVVNVKLKDGKSFLLNESFDDVLLEARY